MTDGGRSQRRRHLVTMGLAAALVAFTVANALALQAVHEQEVLQRPTPPVGWYRVIPPAELASTWLMAMAWSWVAAIPALLILRWLGRRATVGGGTVLRCALLSAVVVTALGGRIQPVVRSLLGIPPPTSDGLGPSSLYLTPVVEELLLLGTVALVVALRGRPWGGVRAGIVLGLAAGIGMTAVEASLYVVQTALEDGIDVAGTIALRFSLLGFNLHPATAALSGGALAAWLAGGARPRKAWLPIAGLALAISTHVLWNRFASAVATEVVAVDPGLGHPSPLAAFLGGSLVALAFLAIPFAILAVAWWRGGGRPLATEESRGTDPADPSREFTAIGLRGGP